MQNKIDLKSNFGLTHEELDVLLKVTVLKACWQINIF